MFENTKNQKRTLLFVMALVNFSLVSSAGSPSISFQQTVGLDLTQGACGIDTVIAVTPGTQVNFCYTVNNDGSDAFEFHDLDTSAYGTLLTGLTQPLMPGESFSFNDVRSISSNVLNEAQWSAKRPYYSVSTIPFVFNDISASGSSLGLSDDGETNVVLPFAFSLYGNSSSTIRIGNNGVVLISGVLSNITPDNPTLPVYGLPAVAPLWDDHAAGSGDVFYQVLGVAPNRVAVVQWHNRNHFDSNPGDTVTFQVALFEGSNEIQFRYLDLIYDGSGTLDNGASATIGLNEGNAVTSFTYPDPVMDMMTISLIPLGETPPVTDSSTAEVSVLSPQVAVNPGIIEVTVDDIVGMTSEVLVISNEGQGNLEWSVNEATAPARISRPLSFHQPKLQENQSLGPPPIKSQKKLDTDSLKTNNIMLGGGTTAYAYGGNNSYEWFATFDINNPKNYTEILSPPIQRFYSGDFVDGVTTMYGISYDDFNLYSTDVSDGSTSLIGPSIPAAGMQWQGISWDMTTDTVYASASDCVSSVLYTLNISTGAVTEVGPITNTSCIIDIAVSATGQMYGHDIVTDTIVEIDKNTGAGTVIGATGFDANYVGGMDFDLKTNTLYLAAFNTGIYDDEIRTVDLITGVTTSVGSINEYNYMDALGIATNADSCYLAEDVSWLSLSNTSGVVGTNDTDEIMVGFDATGLAVGVYDAKICIFTNDYDEPMVWVPVSMEVSDLIYANGFEAPMP